MAPRSVLVTGMSGLIGTALRRHLDGKYELAALNRRPIPGVKCHQADVADLAAIAPAFDGVDTVVHLAALAHGGVAFDDLLRANVVGTYNVFEAARRAGVGRVVYASSGATVSAWERDPPYRALVDGRYDEAGTWKTMTHESPTRPAGLYGASKIWGEAVARHYADAHGLSAICVRVGHVNAEDRPLAARDYSVWCSQHDGADRDKKVAAPTLVLWGEAGGRRPQAADMLGVWKERCAHVEGHAVLGSGHFIPEEQPAAVIDAILSFAGPPPRTG